MGDRRLAPFRNDRTGSVTPLQKAINAATGKPKGSEAEDALAWQIKHCSDLPQPTRHVQLVAGRKFEVDFVWDKQSICVEVDGGVWMQGHYGQGGGAHSRPANILRDMEKSNLVQRLGYRLFRFTPEQVKNGQALEFIKELF